MEHIKTILKRVIDQIPNRPTEVADANIAEESQGAEIQGTKHKSDYLLR